MKKLLILILILALIIAGLFLWKGGHHALYLADRLEDWLGEDSAGQELSLSVNELNFSGELFWLERNDRRVYGLDAEGFSLWVREGVVYMDTGKAYTIPDFSPEPDQIKQLVAAAILHGRVTKEDGKYLVSMETEELTLHARIRTDEEAESIQFSFQSGDTDISGILTRSPARSRTIPQAVVDAMVRADMEPPMSLTEPLNALLPALDGLDELRADVTLELECGILTVSDTVSLSIEDDKLMLERNGEQHSLSQLDGISPMTAGMLLLRNGEYAPAQDHCEFRLTLDAETTASLCASLIPQIGEFGMTFGESEATLVIRNGTLDSALLTASGEVPFLVTIIPVSFRASVHFQ